MRPRYTPATSSDRAAVVELVRSAYGAGWRVGSTGDFGEATDYAERVVAPVPMQLREVTCDDGSRITYDTARDRFVRCLGDERIDQYSSAVDAALYSCSTPNARDAFHVALMDLKANPAEAKHAPAVTDAQLVALYHAACRRYTVEYVGDLAELPEHARAGIVQAMRVTLDGAQ